MHVYTLHLKELEMITSGEKKYIFFSSEKFNTYLNW